MSRYGPRVFSLYPSRIYHYADPTWDRTLCGRDLFDNPYREPARWSSSHTAEKYGLRACKPCQAIR